MVYKHLKYIETLKKNILKKAIYMKHTDKEGNIINCVCIINCYGVKVQAYAKPAVEDKDFASTYTGYEIASVKAVMKFLRIYKNKMYDKYMTLKNLVDIVEENSPDAADYATKLLIKHCKMYHDRYEAIKEYIKWEHTTLMNYIDTKDKLNKRIKLMRERGRYSEELEQ